MSAEIHCNLDKTIASKSTIDHLLFAYLLQETVWVRNMYSSVFRSRSKHVFSVMVDLGEGRFANLVDALQPFYGMADKRTNSSQL